MEPVAENAEADEILALDGDELLGELAASAAKIERCLDMAFLRQGPIAPTAIDERRMPAER